MMNRAVVRASPLFVRVGLTPRRVRGAPGPRRSRAPQTTQAASSRSRTSATLLPMVSAQEEVGDDLNGRPERVIRVILEIVRYPWFT